MAGLVWSVSMPNHQNTMTASVSSSLYSSGMPPPLMNLLRLAAGIGTSFASRDYSPGSLRCRWSTVHSQRSAKSVRS